MKPTIQNAIQLNSPSIWQRCSRILSGLTLAVVLMVTGGRVAAANAATAASPTPAVKVDGKTYTNRLINSHDPYLLLHAHNPGDWYPWGAEALETAKRENKPIFVSIGYSTCYW